ncbi:MULTISPECIES: LapA family protein [Calditerrivibrio]|jgi:uncharacterized integral membrane protein|uniref:Lipopolysaccharide assembly protein A domain-containing protein n=1 Tax=Calditerrivibrio nitroreducens TaxID=477976 RepID=A0A2J6WKH3_9BACT|nr:MAG: hypothetical protein C0187_04890 [Calditerrivibrio nitroreducens]
MKIIVNILKLIIILFLIIFSAMNIQNVEIHYMIGQTPMQIPLFIVIIISFLLGVFVYWLFSLKNSFKKFIEIRSLRTELNKTKNELNRIKSSPLNKDVK